MTSSSFEDAALEGPMALTLPGVFFSRFSGQRIFGRVFGCDDFAHGRMELPIKKKIQMIYRHAFTLRTRGSSNFTAIHKMVARIPVLR